MSTGGGTPVEGTTGANLAAYFSTIFTGLFGLCTYMVWRYAEAGFPIITFVTNVIGYFVSFGIILVVPIDIATVIYDRRSFLVGNDPQYDANIVALNGWYSFFFGTIIVFGFLLVFEEYFNTDGSPDTPVNNSVNIDDFIERQYTADDIGEFISFAIKIRMQGSNSSVVPRCKDLRAIALAT